MNNLTILYQDDDLVAVDKPCGLMVHRSHISDDNLFVLQIVRDQIGQFVYPVHRLDRATSGVLIFALSQQTSSHICLQFSNSSIQKTYIAVVRGHTEESGRIDYSFDDLNSEKSRTAITDFHTLSQTEIPSPVGRYPTARYSLLKLSPVTGRRHQIRRHCKHIFHPIIGDIRYGDGKHNRFFREHFGIHRMLLHAAEITLTHPSEDELFTIQSPLPKEMANLFHELGWSPFI